MVSISHKKLFFLPLLFAAFGCTSAISRGKPLVCPNRGEERIAIESPERIRLAVIGDIGDDAEHPSRQTMAQLASALERENRSSPLDASLILGDNFYPCGLEDASRWKIIEPLAKLGIPMYPVLGNHDHGIEGTCASKAIDPCAQLTSSAPPALASIWRFPAPAYTIVVSDLLAIAMIDTTPIAEGYDDPAGTIERIESLESANVPWRVVAGHHVIASSGNHAFQRSSVGRMRRLLPAMRRARIDVYTSGHDHHLELISREDEPLYVISGSGSKTRTPRRHARGSQFRRKIRGYAIFDVTRERLTITFHALDGTLLSAPAVLAKP